MFSDGRLASCVGACGAAEVTRRHACRGLQAQVRRPSRDLRAGVGAGGGTRTHTTLPSRDFKSLASTNSATSAFEIRDLSLHPAKPNEVAQLSRAQLMLKPAGPPR